MQESKQEQGSTEKQPDSDGAFTDIATLFTLVGASARDTTRLLGLETRLVVKTMVMMVVFSVALGIALAGLWVSITLVIAAGLYEYTRLGMTLSICAATLVNLACAAALFCALKRLARRLTFPQTRFAVRTVFDEASHMMSQDRNPKE